MWRNVNNTVTMIIKLAEKVIEIKNQFEYIEKYCEKCLLTNASDAVYNNSKPDFTIIVSREDIAYERQKSEEEDHMSGNPVRCFHDGYLETLAVYRKIAQALLPCDILLFHGSVIAVDGEGYLFTAKSGTGKSTHTKLWRELFGSRAVMVNDDKPLLKVTDGGVTAYGTPWDGKHHLSTNIGVPLQAICILVRGDDNSIRQLTPKEAYPRLLQQSYRPADIMNMRRCLKLVERMSNRVSLYELHCNMNPEAAIVSYEAMVQKQQKNTSNQEE